MTLRDANQPSKRESTMKYILGILGFLYLVLPTGGLVEFIPDYIPVVGHIDEFLASYAVAAVIGATKGIHHPTAIKLIIVGILGVFGFLYLVYPSAGIVEFLPDAIPFAGNFDEFVASSLAIFAANSVRRRSLPPAEDDADLYYDNTTSIRQ